MIPLDSSALQRVSRGDPDWLAAARADAFALFESLDMPSPKDEVWKYVDLGFSLAEFSLPLEAGAGAPAPPGWPDDGLRIDIVDGHATGSPRSQRDGISVRPLAEALRDDPAVEARYGGLGDIQHDKFSAALRAFGVDGAHVRVAKGTYAREPIYIGMRCAAAGAVSFPRAILEIEEGAEASIVVEYASDDAIESVVVPELDVAVGANANLRLTLVQAWGARTTSIGRARVVADRDGQLTLAEAGLGGALSRLHLAVDLEGRGSSAQIIGAYFGDGSQVLDYRYFMRHIGENTTSDMFLKGGVEDEALSIFTGMIRIEESAQRTNAFQTNRNLLLSEHASAQSVPNLEILANDVKCGHGSTVGPLDEEQRYYLMSRGLSGQRADRLQVRGFFEEALARFPEQAIASPVRDRINAKYVEAQREGRV